MFRARLARLGHIGSGRRARAFAATSIVSLVGALALLTSSSTCDSFGCECAPCGAAIDLAVFDTDGAALDTGWTVEATLDGFTVDDVAANCDAAVRFGNACSFGFQTGIYRITVRGDGFQTREIAARNAAKSGDDCCNFACINATSVDAFLETTAAQAEEQ